MTQETSNSSAEAAPTPAPVPTPETNSPMLTNNPAIKDDASLHEIINPPSQQIIEQPVTDWYYADGVKGIGDRPEYFDGKFKNVLEQAKSYKELEKRFGGFKGAPKDGYSTEIKDLPNVTFDAQDAGLKALMDTCSKSNMSQDVFTDLLSMYAKSQLSQVPNKDEELKALGPDGADQIRVLKTWAHNHLDQQELKTFEGIANRADAIKMLNKLRGVSNAAKIPAGGNNPVKGYSQADYARDVANPRYETDHQFREEARKKAYESFG